MFSAIWPTSGYLHDGSAYRLPASALHTTAFAYSSWPTALFRTPLASDSSRGGESLEQVRARRGTNRTVTSDHRPRPTWTAWLTQAEQRVGNTVVPDRGHIHRWGRYAGAIARWEHITGRPAPAPALLNENAGPRPAPEFIEWLMGLPAGWVTDDRHGLTDNQQIAILGNGVLPSQAVAALRT